MILFIIYVIFINEINHIILMSKTDHVVLMNKTKYINLIKKSICFYVAYLIMICFKFFLINKFVFAQSVSIK